MQKLCYGDSICLKKFVQEIFSLKFSQDPDYEHFKKLLKEALIQENPKKSAPNGDGVLPEMKESMVKNFKNKFK